MPCVKSFPEEVRSLPQAELEPQLRNGAHHRPWHALALMIGELATIAGWPGRSSTGPGAKGRAARGTADGLDDRRRRQIQRHAIHVSRHRHVRRHHHAVGGLRLSWPARHRAALSRPQPRRNRPVLGGLIVASSIAVLTTVGIAASMLSEAARFFNMVPAAEVLLRHRLGSAFCRCRSSNTSGSVRPRSRCWRARSTSAS